MGLEIFWFIVIAFFWVGFFILEGFDFGVGALHMLVGRTDTERRVAINSIGPFWDGNEVWLVVAGAATFAAFPSWYATMFSTFYLALMLIILALIGRGISFEYRGKVASDSWRSAWDWVLTVSSIVLPVLFGVALGDLLHGLPINKAGNFTGNFLDLLTPYGLWTGITFLALTLAHGAIYLGLKTTGDVERRALKMARPLAWIAAATVVGFAIWTHVQSTNSVLLNPLQVAAILLAIGAAWAARDGSVGWAFAATTATIAAVVASIFVSLYHDVMVSSTNKAYDLTVSNSASGHYALSVMTVIAVVLVPLILGYQGWSYHVFRARIQGPGNGSDGTAPVAPAPDGSRETVDDAPATAT